MTLLISRLRRWLAAAGITLVILVVAGYFAARDSVQNALKQVPEKIGIEIQQSAKGFTISKSYQGRTVFKIDAGKAVQFKQGGRTELHNVEITIYGRDSKRFDRITGDDFEYNALTGMVTGRGQVKFDLEANPGGFGEPDQSTPLELKAPIHLTATDLVFDQKTGDAHCDGLIEFSLPQVDGSAVGMKYEAQTRRLTFVSQIAVNIGSFSPIRIVADSATLTNAPRILVIQRPQLHEGGNQMSADKVTVFLRPENRVDRFEAQGNVKLASTDGQRISASGLDAHIEGLRNTLHQAVLWGDVRFDNPAGQNRMTGKAGRVILNFAGKNVLQNVHADEGVMLIGQSLIGPSWNGQSLVGQSRPSGKKAKLQDIGLKATALDLMVTDGKIVHQAETSGPSAITISSRDAGDGGTLITAGKFHADFDSQGAMSEVHGAPEARIINKVHGKPDRISTSDAIYIKLEPGFGIKTFQQNGNFAYAEGPERARADSAEYSPGNQTLLLTGSPAVTDGSMDTSAQSIKLNRVTGQAYAEGEVKSTYKSSLGGRGGISVSSSPIHVTADKMTASGNPSVVQYFGNARLSQDADQVQAPEIAFDREQRLITATSTPSQHVSARLFQVGKGGKSTAILIAADRFTYSDGQRLLHFEGSVSANSAGIRISAATMDCFLLLATEIGAEHNHQTVDKIVARDNVLVTQAGRKVTGDKLVYSPADDKFVMTGGPPSIFDAEHGNVTGDSLTLFGHDGRVLVEGSKQSPTVTETRVAR